MFSLPHSTVHIQSQTFIDFARIATVQCGQIASMVRKCGKGDKRHNRAANCCKGYQFRTSYNIGSELLMCCTVETSNEKKAHYIIEIYFKAQSRETVQRSLDPGYPYVTLPFVLNRLYHFSSLY